MKSFGPKLFLGKGNFNPMNFIGKKSHLQLSGAKETIKGGKIE